MSCRAGSVIGAPSSAVIHTLVNATGRCGSVSSSTRPASIRPTASKYRRSVSCVGPSKAIAALIEPQRPLAEPADRTQVVRHEDDRPAGALQVLHPADAAALELRVADGERLVDDEDVGLEVGRDGERQPQPHPRGVALQRRVEEALDPGEGGDLVEARADVAAGHAEDRPAEEHVLAPRELVVEARPDVEQGAEPAADAGDAGGRRRDPREDPEQRGLARTVAADDADQLAGAHRERHVLQRPEVLALAATAPAHPVRDDLGEQLRARAPADRVALAQPRRPRWSCALDHVREADLDRAEVVQPAHHDHDGAHERGEIRGRRWRRRRRATSGGRRPSRRAG